jgi:hypothetical protein
VPEKHMTAPNLLTQPRCCAKGTQTRDEAGYLIPKKQKQPKLKNDNFAPSIYKQALAVKVMIIGYFL